MKLNQSYNEFAGYKYPEFEDFRRKILRQGTGFGLSTGSAFDPGVIERYANRARTIRSRSLINSAAAAGTWIGRLPKAIAGGLDSVREQARNRSAIRKLLRNPDYLLRDMGLERQELEYLLDTGGSLEVHFRKSRRLKAASASETQPTAVESPAVVETECANDTAVLNRAA